MRSFPLRGLAALTLALALAACGSSAETGSGATGKSGSSSSSGAGGGASTGSSSSSSSSSTSSSSGGSGGAGGGVDKAAACTGTFGAALTNAFGRIDGTLLAVVKPSDQQCPMPNSDHVVLEVTMNGAVYRLVVNVQSTIGDPKVLYRELDHAMPAPAWAEGWHTGITFDYVTDLGVHADATFTPYTLVDLSNKIADDLTLGQKLSVYAGSTGGASAHNVHRNNTGVTDGAIVLDPDTATPHFLLFHFADQTF